MEHKEVVAAADLPGLTSQGALVAKSVLPSGVPKRIMPLTLFTIDVESSQRSSRGQLLLSASAVAQGDGLGPLP